MSQGASENNLPSFSFQTAEETSSFRVHEPSRGRTRDLNDLGALRSFLMNSVGKKSDSRSPDNVSVTQHIPKTACNSSSLFYGSFLILKSPPCPRREVRILVAGAATHFNFPDIGRVSCYPRLQVLLLVLSNSALSFLNHRMGGWK